MWGGESEGEEAPERAGTPSGGRGGLFWQHGEQSASAPIAAAGPSLEQTQNPHFLPPTQLTATPRAGAVVVGHESRCQLLKKPSLNPLSPFPHLGSLQVLFVEPKTSPERGVTSAMSQKRGAKAGGPLGTPGSHRAMPWFIDRGKSREGSVNP